MSYPPSTPPGTAAFTARVADAVRARRAVAIDDLGREGTLWLAVTPLWTRHAAEAARFPVPSVIKFVRRARDIGWCETRGSLRGEGAPGLRFWMPDEVRRDVLDLLSRGGSRQGLTDNARLIAGNIDQRVPLAGDEPGTRTEVPDALRYWAQLLSAPVPDLALVDRVAQAVDAQDLPAAQQLVTAGEALAPLLAGTMELAVDRARRLFSLGSRRRQDARALDRYLDRPELSGTVHQLLGPDAARWALHLRGVGGVGKTMLVRYLASGRYAAERDEQGITVARVDFDHMSPDYPARRPVQLLLELADELALHTAASGQADQALARFGKMATSVHESLSSVREEHGSPLRNPAVLDAIDTFADTLRLLPRPLLILDTCEELDKADAGDPAAPAVTSTLAIIERIHQRAPDCRVLLAGRRPLPKRDYLAVAAVRGFTTDEAARYLSAFAARRLPGDLVRAMIRQSPAVDADIPAPGHLPDRVSPFDLALYREWAEGDPDLDVRRVERGSHAYVEGRIIERLDPGLRRALPVLATAGRCRVTTVAAFLGADPAVLGPRLAEQEWIDAVGDPPTHVSAGPALALRLRSYFAEPDRLAAFAAETARLAAMLSSQVRDASLDEVDGDELLAALRLAEPADAARLWDELAGRAAAEGRWTWLFNITRWISGESAENLWASGAVLRATVLAASIAASRRVIPGFNPAASWAEVRRLADRHPDPEAARCLRTRAVLGALANAPDAVELWLALSTEPSSWHYDSPDRLAEVAAATADLAHRLLEGDEEAAARRLLLLAGHEWPAASLPIPASADPARPLRATAFPDATSPWSGYQALRAWLLVAFARLLADEDPPAARHALDVAEAEAQSPPTGAPRSWFDVILPDDLAARVRIEQGLIGWPFGGDPGNVRWTAYTEALFSVPDAGMLATIDGERHASLVLLRRLGREVIDSATVNRWAERDEYRPGRIATSSAHDLVPPLFVSIAEAWLAAGEPRRAIEHVARHRQAALGTRDDEATVRHADAVTVRIARRLRLDGQLALLSRLATPDDAGEARLALADDARRAIAVIRGEPPKYLDAGVNDRPAGWHAWWQCQTLPVGPVPSVQWDREDTALAADIEVDLDELGQLSRGTGQHLQALLADWLGRPRQAPRARTTEPYRHWRAELRRSALDPRAQEPSYVSVPVAPSEELPRLLAETAFDEAELLALRFPAAAVVLFELAASAYGVARDDLGRVLAELARVSTVLAAQNAAEQPNQVALNRFITAVDQVPPAVAIPFLGSSHSGRDEPWRYWARVSAGIPALSLLTPEGRGGWVLPVARYLARRTGALVGWVTALSGVSRSEVVLLRRTALAGVGLGLAGSAAAVLWLLIARLPGVAPLIVAGVAAGAAAVAAVVAGRWREQALVRLADGTAVGTAFGPSSLEFTALIQPGGQPGGNRSLTLWVHSRSPWGVPWRQWPPLLGTLLASSLASAFRPHRGRRNGYRGRFEATREGRSTGPTGEGSLSWTGEGPESDASWWSGGTATGRIVTSPAEAGQPWERIITQSLGQNAAGRVEWWRQVFVSADGDPYASNLISTSTFSPHGGAGVRLDASPGWEPVYADHYGVTVGSLVQVRHAIGAAVSTSAGARLEVGSRSADSMSRLLGTEELRAGNPSLIIIQAEPTAADAEAGAPGQDAAGQAAGELAERQAAHDLQVQLALALDLIRSAAAPAVLLLPVLPATQVAAMAQAIARYARSAAGAAPAGQPDPGKLQAELRALLRPHVRPAVLDDIVLFINDRG